MDCQSFVNDIIKLLENKDFYDKIGRQGIERAKSFSWKKTTQEIIKVFNQVYEI